MIVHNPVACRFLQNESALEEGRDMNVYPEFLNKSVLLELRT